MRALITCASGYVTSLLLPSFLERYDMALVDAIGRSRRGEHVYKHCNVQMAWNVPPIAGRSLSS